MAFHLYVSTSLEVLAETFRAEIYESLPADNLLKPVTVTVQTQGIATWLRQSVAAKSPVAMNLEMPFLQTAIDRTLKEYFPSAEEDLENHSTEHDSWKIFDYLTLKHGNGDLQELDMYLRNDPDLRKRSQVSRQIAATLDQYRAYRPDMIENWRNAHGPAEDWQETLFRNLFSKERTREFYIQEFIRQAAEYRGQQFKKLLTVFGLSSMPPFFLQFFFALSKFQDVALFYLSPTDAFWADADNVRKNGKRVAYAMDSDANPLLNLLGIQGKEFFRELLRSDLWNLANDSPQKENHSTTLLGCIQEDIRKNQCRECGSVKTDGSFRIESCHTPLREVEVLHDRILHEIQEHGRKSGDFLVTAPNIETYVPYIETVFGTGPLAEHYSIADRTLKDAGEIFPALLQILKITASDYTVSEIFSLLEVQSLQNKFHLNSEDIQQIQSWCTSAGIRWGIDGVHREEKCGICFEDFSWRQGIRRILLGYAIQEDFENQLELPDLPLDFAEGAQAEKFGNFLNFLDELFALKNSVTRVQTPAEWFRELKLYPDRFFQPEENSAVAERADLIRKLSDLAYSARDCNSQVPFPVILDILEHSDLSRNQGNAFLRGKITFCSMVPMRTVPMPVIAILGLNAGDFPRKDSVPGFNLIAKKIHPTDRSKNLEDRYLLLETILAAKETLMIFYQGQSSRDNSEIFPTPPLAELMIYLDRITGTDSSNRKYLVRHHLQSYAEEYLTGSNPAFFTYSETALAAAEGIRNLQEDVLPPILFADLSDDSLIDIQKDLPDEASLDELESFFKCPVTFYFQNKKGFRTGNWDRTLPEDIELFNLNGLEGYIIKKEIVENAVPGTEDPLPEQFTDLLRKKGKFPYGAVGTEQKEICLAEIAPMLAETFLQAYTGQKLQDVQADCISAAGKNIRFTGKLTFTDGTSGERNYWNFHPGKYQDKHLTKFYIRHALLSAGIPDFNHTVCQFEDKMVTLQKMDPGTAKNILLRYAAMRQLGMEAIVPFIGGIEKNKKTTDGYIGKLKEQLFDNDIMGALLFKDADFTETFAELADNTSKLFRKDFQV